MRKDVVRGRRAWFRGPSVLSAVLVAMALGSATVSQAGPTGNTLYVAPSGSDTAGCMQAAPCLTIGRAVQVARSGDTIVVERGTYREGVVIAKRVSLIGVGRPLVDAVGRPNGFLLAGSAAQGARVVGFKVEHAVFEGILARHTSHVTIARNLVLMNDLGRRARPLVGECAAYKAGSGSPGSSSHAGIADLRAGGCGEGLHLLSTSSSVVIDNIVDHNAGGIYLTDEVGPAAHNLISHNRVNDNRFDCGITLASHSSRAVSPGGVPRPSVAGIYANIISDNVADRNGLRLDGSGILLAASFPGGGAYNNLVVDNTAVGNSHPGISIHSHSLDEDLDGNVLIGNVIGRNAVNGGPNHGPGDVLPGVRHTTGILIFSPFETIRGTIIAANRISGDYFGIWTRLVTPLDQSLNTYRRVRIPLRQLYRPVAN